MNGLTHEERGRVIKGFLMASGSIALAMVLFALVGGLTLMTFILAIVGIVMVVVASPVLWLLRHPARVVYGIMAIGLAVITGAVGGNFVITMVVASLR